jgi:uncharacterized repeat protein (TIGR01451 family)
MFKPANQWLKALGRPIGRQRRRLSLQSLEDRTVPAVFNIADGDVAGLVAAINLSNGNSQADTINLAPLGTYAFTAVADTADGGNALPSINVDNNSALNTLTINGNGSRFLRDGTAPDMRFFRVTGSLQWATLRVTSLFMIGGSADGDGGAVLTVGGDASFDFCTLTNNHASGSGGAIKTFTAANRKLDLSNCVVENNSADETLGQGGGIHTHGPLTVTLVNVSLSSNRSDFSGGGLWNQGGTITIIGCGLNGNRVAQSVAGGGAIFNQGNLTIVNSTLVLNRAGNGGAIDLPPGNGLTTITHSTITNNNAFFGIPSGGGINVGAGILRMGHTIVAQNVLETPNAFPKGPDIAGNVTSLGWNLIGDGTDAVISGITAGNQVGVAGGTIDPLLDALKFNGGLGMSRQPLPGSPALNTGNPLFVPPPATDQRGFARVGDLVIDIGAIERIEGDIQVTITDGVNTAPIGGISLYTITVTNVGRSAFSNVAIDDVLDPLRVLDSTWTATTSGGAVVPLSGAGDLHLSAFMPAGSTIVITQGVHFRTSAVGNFVNTVTAGPPFGGIDLDPTNNLASDLDVMVPPSLQNFSLAAGPGSSGGPHVIAYDGAGLIRHSFFAFDPFFTGGVEVAVGDYNGDGFDDIYCAAGPGGGPHVKVFDGHDLTLLASFFAYDGSFRGGVQIAAGDVNGDGRDDIITGTLWGGGPHVRVIDALTGAELRSFFAFAPTFSGGVTVAAGDFNLDGLDDLVVGTGPGLGVQPNDDGPRVKVIDSATGGEIWNFQPYHPGFLGGIRVSARDVTGDFIADIETAAGPGGGSHLVEFDGRNLNPLRSFFVYDPSFTGGVFLF